MSSKQDTPKLRFPEFSGEWEDKKFTDLYRFGNTNSFSRDKLSYEQGQIYNIHYGDIHTKFRTNFKLENELVPRVIALNSVDAESLVEVGDIIIADASEDYADIGKTIEIISTAGKPTVSGLHTILGKRRSDQLVLGFISYLMQTYSQKLKIMKIAQGVKVLGLPKIYVRNLSFNIPSDKEQRRIALFLSSVDEWLENLKDQKKALEKYKKGMMQKIFSQEIRFKDENGKDFPDWEEKKIGEIFNITAGGDVGKLDFSKNRDNEHRYPVYANALTNEGLIGYSNKPSITKDAVTVTGRGDIGHAISREAGFSPVVRLLTLIPKDTQSVYFFECAINIERIFVESTGVPQLTVPQLSSYKVHFPAFEEQQKIAEFLSLIDQQIEAKENQIKKAEEWKKGLLQQMFV